MLRAWTALLLMLLFGGSALAQASGPTPYLQIETGMHLATINRMAISADGQTIATVSDDKTARLWSADTLKPLGVIRPPIGPNDEGALFAVATWSKYVAVAGRIPDGGQFMVQFYRLPDLKLAGHLSGLPAPVSALGASSDGVTLAVGMVGGRGLAFFDLHTGAQVGADIAYDGQVQWIDMAADGRTIATGEDGRVRLYGPDHRRIAEAPLPRNGRPYAAAFAPDGRSIAVGDQNNPAVWLLDAGTLAPRASVAGATGRVGGFAVVAFAADGRSILAAGTYKMPPNGRRLMRRWALDGGGPTETEIGADTVTDIVPLGNGQIVSDAEPLLYRLDENGRPSARLAAGHIDFRDAGLGAFGLSSDGMAIELPLDGGQRAVFDVRQRRLSRAMSGPALPRPIERGGGLEVTQWRNASDPRLNGRPMPFERFERGEVGLAAAVARDGSGAAFGTNFYLRYQRRNGTSWKVPVPSSAWAVNVSGDGARVAAGLGDGTVRWFDAETGNALLTLFLDPVHQHWVLATPEGFFDHDEAGPGESDGRTLIGYRFNDPVGQTSRFVETGQLYPVYYRPDLVGLALKSNPLARSLIAQAYARRGAVETVLMRGMPPQLEVLQVCGTKEDASGPDCPAGSGADGGRPTSHPAARLATKSGALMVRYRLFNAGGQPGVAAVFHNDAHIAPRLFAISEDAHSRTEAVVIPLGAGVNTIGLRPITGNGEIEGSERAAIRFDVVREPAPQSDHEVPRIPHPRTLFLLSVGVSRYSPDGMALANARNDAASVAALMQAPDPPVYEESEVTTLYDEQATLAGITAAIRAIADKAEPDDLVLLFFAGHGKEVDGSYVFAPSDFGTHNPDLTRIWTTHRLAADEALDQIFRKEGFGHDRLIGLLQNIKASRVALVLDTCYSAAIASQDAVIERNMNRTMTNTLGHATGRFVLSSATATANDGPPDPAKGAYNARGHGLFTGYLLDAFEGRDDTARPGNIDIVRIAQFTIDSVKRATVSGAQQQEPTFYFAGNDFFALRTARAARQHAWETMK